MPFIAAVSKTDLPDRVEQIAVKEQAREMFSKEFPQVDRLIYAFENTGIATRNFAKPLSYYGETTTFKQRNDEYIRLSLRYSVLAVKEALQRAGVTKDELTDIVFVSTTGLATPSLDALIINQMHLDPHINRTPVWGLGCAGGVSGVAKANTLAKANPDAVVLLVAVELCSLTLIKSDYSKSNFIGSSLFSDGIAAVIVKGDSHQPADKQISIQAASSKLYYDSLDVMGWDFRDDGFKVVFSKDIPTFIHQNISTDINAFLQKQRLQLSDIKNFVFHPGGTKVLEAYEDALKVNGDFLKNTRQVITDYGNMSSVTVLYVLEKFLSDGFEDGYGLMLAMGPGFSSEMVLLTMKN